MNMTAKPLNKVLRKCNSDIEFFPHILQSFLHFFPSRCTANKVVSQQPCQASPIGPQKEKKPYPTSRLQQNNAASSDPLFPHRSCSYSTIPPTQCSTSSDYLLVFFPKKQPIEKIPLLLGL